jgi:GT2 family glycosyltransferase
VVAYRGSMNGYISKKNFLYFWSIVEVYRLKLSGQKCLFALDGHASHVSVEAVNVCPENEIE